LQPLSNGQEQNAYLDDRATEQLEEYVKDVHRQRNACMVIDEER